MEIKM